LLNHQVQYIWKKNFVLSTIYSPLS